MAHRDNTGTGPGRERQRLRHRRADRARPLLRDDGLEHATAPRSRRRNTLVFLSTDGGAYGGLGAARFAATLAVPRSHGGGRQPRRARRTAPPRLELAGDRPRSPAAALVRTAAARVLEQTGSELGRPRAIEQLIDLGFPFTLYEQGPFVGRGHLCDHAHDRRATPALVVHGHAPAAEPAAPDRGRALGAGARELARPGPRARAGNAELRLPRLALRPRLGDPALARGGTAAVPARRGRPVRALPAATRPHRARPAQLPQPARLLALGGAALRRLLAARPAGGTPRRGRSRPRARPRRRGRRPRSSSSACSRSRAGWSRATGWYRAAP